ncbi:MAG: hypothetical protein CVV47_07800 [Spirochaetae bacterium HGW-Spirochaetae-3]|jgi:hypothetical protein|nr:MAG: hypothetical protein CVV47_07800 [Spirochaetae bacterium HGW-Spirochaetae-3]
MNRSAAVALACAVSILRWAGPEPGLRIFGESGAPLTTIAVPAGFTLSFIHSINLSAVDEEFTVDETGSITLERVLYNQMSTGMPSGDEDGFAIVDGRFATMPRRRLEEIAVRVSPIPGHALGVNGSVRPLTEWAPVGGLLVLRGTKKNNGLWSTKDSPKEIDR